MLVKVYVYYYCYIDLKRCFVIVDLVSSKKRTYPVFLTINTYWVYSLDIWTLFR